MLAAVVNFTAQQGATFRRILRPVDGSDNPIQLDGWEVRAQVRRDFGEEAELLVDSTEDNHITVEPYSTGNQIVWEIPGSEMESVPGGRWRYDLEIEDPAGYVERLMEGKFIVRPGVTF